MVDEPRWIPIDVPVEVTILIQRKNVVIVLLAAAERLVFADLLSSVLNHSQARGQILLAENADTMNAGFPDFEG